MAFKYLALLVIISISFGCNKTREIIPYNPHPSPGLTITTLDGIKVESDTGILKDDDEDAKTELSYYLVVSGDSLPKKLTLKSNNGDGKLTMNGKKFDEGVYINGKYQFVWKDNKAETSSLLFELVDSQNQTSNTKLEITTLKK